MPLVKLLLLLVSIMLFSGCSPDSISMAQQDIACKQFGGVYKYGSVFRGPTKCYDGRTVLGWNNIHNTEVINLAKKYRKKD